MEKAMAFLWFPRLRFFVFGLSIAEAWSSIPFPSPIKHALIIINYVVISYSFLLFFTVNIGKNPHNSKEKSLLYREESLNSLKIKEN